MQKDKWVVFAKAGFGGRGMLQTIRSTDSRFRHARIVRVEHAPDVPEGMVIDLETEARLRSSVNEKAKDAA